MLSEIALTSVAYSGYFYQPIRQAFEVGKLPDYEEEERITRKLERESKRIQPLYPSNRTQSRYNSNGEIIQGENLGKYLDFMA